MVDWWWWWSHDSAGANDGLAERPGRRPVIFPAVEALFVHGYLQGDGQWLGIPKAEGSAAPIPIPIPFFQKKKLFLFETKVRGQRTFILCSSHVPAVLAWLGLAWLVRVV